MVSAWLKNPHILDVGQPTALVPVMGVTYAESVAGDFTANLTFYRHLALKN